MFYISGLLPISNVPIAAAICLYPVQVAAELLGVPLKHFKLNQTNNKLHECNSSITSSTEC